jgi:hypothetical protein
MTGFLQENFGELKERLNELESNIIKKIDEKN